MTTQLATAQTARIRALIVVGVALVTAGLYSTVTLLYSVFARYMYVEDLDLGLDENTVFVLTRITPTDRGILILGGILALLGVAALIAAAIRGRYRRRSGFVRAILLLLTGLGLRSGEIAALRLDDIGWRAGTIGIATLARLGRSRSRVTIRRRCSATALLRSGFDGR
ncbi:hypothetical protein [Microbacterium lacticum]